MIFRTQDSQEKYSSCCCCCCCCSCLASCSSSDTSYDLTDLLSLGLLLLHPPHQLTNSPLITHLQHIVVHSSLASCIASITTQQLHAPSICLVVVVGPFFIFVFIFICNNSSLQLPAPHQSSSSTCQWHHHSLSSALVAASHFILSLHHSILCPFFLLLSSCFLLLLLLLNHHHLTSPELPAPAGTSTKYHNCLFSPI